jgi:hypothetical protein
VPCDVSMIILVNCLLIYECVRERGNYVALIDILTLCIWECV